MARRLLNDMNTRCPRCDFSVTPAARFCGHCGLSLATGVRGKPIAGRTRHPNPLAVPDGYELILDAVDLYFRTESAWGGKRLLDTENIGVVLLNTGYSLRDVALRLRGEDEPGKELFNVEHTVDELPRGETAMIEIASYDIPAPPRRITVSLVSAAFSPVESN